MYIVFLALRFLRSRLVNFIAVGGVMVGVAVLIVVTSVMDGFRLKVLSVLRGNLSDVVMTPITPPGEPIPPYLEMDRLLREDKRVQATSPQLEHLVFYLWSSDYRGVVKVGDYAVFQMRAVGIDWKRERNVSQIADYVVVANRPEEPFFSQRQKDYFKDGTVMVSRTFAQKFLGVPEGRVFLPRDPEALEPYRRLLEIDPAPDENVEHYAVRLEEALAKEASPYRMLLDTDMGVTFVELGDDDGSGSGGGRVDARWKTLQLPISAVYDGEDTSMDVGRVYFDIDNLRDLAGIEDPYHNIRIKLHDPNAAAAVKKDFANRFPSFQTTVWQDHRADYLKAVNNEKVLLAIVLSFIVLLGGFIILATLTLTVVEKTKDIGVLSALGATRPGIRRLFVGNGLLIGVLGSLLGVGLGRLFTDNVNPIKDFLDQRLNIQIFPPDIYLFREIPTVWDWNGIAWIVGGSILMAFVAGFIPAWRASRMDPVKALRYE